MKKKYFYNSTCGLYIWKVIGILRLVVRSGMDVGACIFKLPLVVHGSGAQPEQPGPQTTFI